MIVDVDDLSVMPSEIYDLCIVGAGAAGITLAMELKELGLRVAMLESGNQTLNMNTQSLYSTITSGMPRKNHIFSRLRMFGGTTNHWTGRCGPLSPSDFEVRPWIDHSGWPITRGDLDPYYNRSLPYLDLIDMSDASEILAGKKIPLPNEGENWGYHIWKYSAPTRFGLKYADDLKNSSNVTVYFNANVTNLDVSDDHTEVTGADVASLSGRKGRIYAKRYVLCCGGIENARILLSSNKKISVGLGNKKDNVGRYFMEHLRTKLMADMGDNPYALSQTYNLYEWQEKQYLVGLEARFSHQKGLGISSVGCWMEYTPNEYSPTRSLTKINNSLRSNTSFVKHAQQIIIGAGDIYANVRRRLLSPGAPMIDKSSNTVVVETEQTPNPESRITLSDKTDALGMPIANVHWAVNSTDIRTAKLSSESIAKKFAKDHGIRLQVPEWMWQDQEMWRANFVDVAHHMGTTRMAETDSEGVVDSDCKVFGMENLYIAGSSVFATSGHVNPTMTITALAIRLADHLKMEV